MQIKMVWKPDNCRGCVDTAMSWQILCGLLIVMALETFEEDMSLLWQTCLFLSRSKMYVCYNEEQKEKIDIPESESWSPHFWKEQQRESEES